MIAAVAGETNPAAGVIVARPATAPVSKPRNFGFFEIRQSTSNQAIAANEAEKAAPENTLVDVQMIGAAGRVYIAGTPDGVTRARTAITRALQAIVGRTH